VGDVTPRANYRGASGFAEETQQHRRHSPDYWLLISSVALLAIGLIVIYSISPALGLANGVSSSFYTTRQTIDILLSGVAFIIASRIPFQSWRRWYKPLLVVGAVTTLLALIIPVNPAYPAHRWVRLGSLSFQSVELLKFALLVWLATMLSERVRNQTISDTKSMLKPLVVALGLTGLIVAGVQSDFGSAVVIAMMMGIMAFVAGMPFKRLLLVGSILAIGIVLAISAVPYRRERLMTFLHPTANCQTTGYQACQALISVGSGGVIGLGLGRSVQAYGYLPEAANDSIFAIYAEKFGFIGVSILLVLFTVFFTKLKIIAERAPDTFSRLFVIGVLAWMSMQTVINIGAMIGLLPLKGITLPLVSYGGTSVVFVMAALGVVFQISRYTHYITEDPINDNRRRVSREPRFDGRRDRGAYHPDFSSRA
jgi:cell division protein FtsW